MKVPVVVALVSAFACLGLGCDGTMPVFRGSEREVSEARVYLERLGLQPYSSKGVLFVEIPGAGLAADVFGLATPGWRELGQPEGEEAWAGWRQRLDSLGIEHIDYAGAVLVRKQDFLRARKAVGEGEVDRAFVPLKWHYLMPDDEKVLEGKGIAHTVSRSGHLYVRSIDRLKAARALGTTFPCDFVKLVLWIDAADALKGQDFLRALGIDAFARGNTLCYRYEAAEYVLQQNVDTVVDDLVNVYLKGPESASGTKQNTGPEGPDTRREDATGQ